MAAAHAVWKGFLEFFLVSVPVKAYSAAAPAGAGAGVRLSLLHADCLGPIRYAKKCAVHGEVPPAEIVRGFELSTDRYVVLDRSEMDSLRPPRSRRIAVQGVVDPAGVPARQYGGRTYYLLPEGPAAQRPYALLRDVLARAGVAGYAQATLHSRQRLVLVRPLGRLLTLSVLLYAEQTVDPSPFEREVADVESSPDELRLGLALAQTAAAPAAHLAAFRDPYPQGLAELIAAKTREVAGDMPGAAGAGAGAPAGASATPPVNLVEALTRSIELAKSGRSTRPPRIVAPSAAERQEDEAGGAGLAGGDVA